MRLPQAALVPLPTPVEGVIPSFKNKITKGGLRQAQARCVSSNSLPMPYYDDDGSELNPNLIKKPQLCLSCKKNH
jgi:hypothetical protein